MCTSPSCPGIKILNLRAKLLLLDPEQKATMFETDESNPGLFIANCPQFAPVRLPTLFFGVLVLWAWLRHPASNQPAGQCRLLTCPCPLSLLAPAPAAGAQKLKELKKNLVFVGEDFIYALCGNPDVVDWDKEVVPLL